MIRRLSFQIETAALLGLILAIGHARGNAGFIGEPLHPFYFVILLIALRYGYLKGLFAALSSSAIYLGLLIHRDGDFHLASLWGEGYPPLAFLAFGMALGLIVEIDKRRIRRLSARSDSLAAAVAEKEKECERLAEINARLSEQLATADVTYGVVFEKTQPLFDERVSEAHRAAHEALRSVLSAEKVYVFRLEGPAFVLAYPEDSEPEGAAFIKKYTDQVDAVRKEHRFLRIDMTSKDDVEADAPILLGPILHAGTDSLYGMLVVGELDLLRYNEGAFLTFQALCQWLGEVWRFRTMRAGVLAPAAPKAAEFDFLLPTGISRDDAAAWLRSALGA